MVHSDINRIYRMKCKLQHLKTTLGRPGSPFAPSLSTIDFDAKQHIQNAIEELHAAEMCLRKFE